MQSSTISPALHRPFFSVVLCTYNRAALIVRALDSLLAQTERDWEAVVVNDGSTDSTPAVVQKYIDADSRIRLIERVNGGVAAARNTGIEHSRGLFVTFLDSDDEYLPEHLEIRRTVLLDHPHVQFLHGGVDVIGDPWVADMHDPSQRINIADCVVGGTFVIRRTVFDTVGMFDVGQYADDALFHARAAEHGVTIGSIDVPTYRYYRDTPDSVCTTTYSNTEQP